MPETPEQKARHEIDAKLSASGWLVQDRDDLDLTAGRGIAVREFPMKSGFGFADYLLYLDRKAVGAVEAKAAGALTGVEAQSAKYEAGLPDNLPAHRRPLPFLFESNGAVTFFTNGLDPKPRSRKLFSFPRPETLAEWVSQSTSLRGRLAQLPSLGAAGLWKVQHQATANLEGSLARGNPRALVQMATGSGKTFTAVNAAYRLLKFGGARRILFLVDRGNLGKQTEDEFANFTPPDDTRKFPTLYTVNQSNPAGCTTRFKHGASSPRCAMWCKGLSTPRFDRRMSAVGAARFHRGTSRHALSQSSTNSSPISTLASLRWSACGRS